METEGEERGKKRKKYGGRKDKRGLGRGGVGGEGGSSGWSPPLKGHYPAQVIMVLKKGHTGSNTNQEPQTLEDGHTERRALNKKNEIGKRENREGMEKTSGS